jgi:hypothetical protein
MSRDGEVGLVVPLQVKPTSAFITSLISIAESDEAIRDCARATQDSRMTHKQWAGVLRGELLQLLGWGVRRMSADARSKPVARPVKAVLSLLPRYGVALHVLRRAAGFAGLGIPTICGFPECGREQTNIVGELGERLGISRSMSVLTGSCRNAGRKLDVEKTTVVVTGRAESVRRVARSFNWRRVLGCAGKCCVVVGDDAVKVTALAKMLRSRQLDQSCARVCAVFLTDSELSDDCIVRVRDGRRWATVAKPLAEQLRSLHPSIVTTPYTGRNSPVSSICGYQVFHCQTDGSPINHSGFGGDPIYGWPGDYLL